jgi:hypothetical protein
MIRTISGVAALLVAATAGLARQPQPQPPTRLTLDPMAAPVPALKYYLLPEVRDQNPGNAALLYLRALNPEWIGHFQRDPKQATRMTELSEKPLGELDAKAAQEFANLMSSKMLKEVDRAARRPYCDWELTERFRAEGVNMVLPEVQAMRLLGNLIRFRTKLELKAGKFDDAAVSLQTGFAMARHVADGPILIQGLVGVAIATMTLQAVEDWIDLPDAPNLYWALTDLPRPLIDLRRNFEGERLFIDALLPGYREMLADPSLPPPSTAQLQTYLSRAVSLSERWQDNDFSRSMGGLVLCLRNYGEAKRMLLEHGRTSRQVEAMPVVHAVFLQQVHEYDVAYDDTRKWLGVPYPVAAAVPAWLAERSGNLAAERSDIAGLLIPATARVDAAPLRIERRLAALRCVEAIRLHAAANGRKLPSKLSEVTIVPVPVDPWSGKQFEYQLDGDKAVLATADPGDDTRGMVTALRYEIAIRGKKGGD